MCCRIAELRCKEVISISDGNRIGFVSDVQIDTCTGRIHALVVPGRGRCFGLFGRKDHLIPWETVRRIGEDIILTTFECPREHRKPCRIGKFEK
ncbi:MAG: PRC-barrel domain-containing protein [Butyricicoccaceae bacterium]